MKHFFWPCILAGITIFSCSSSDTLTPDDDLTMRLPGMPAGDGRPGIVEVDGLIGVEPHSPYREFYLLDSIRVVIDDPYETEGIFDAPLNLIIYALPNGNSIEWTMGKLKNDRDDWHYNIQYIDAQISWLRDNTSERYTVAYLEAPQLSWPAWRRSQQNDGEMISQVLDSLRSMYPQARVMLNSHSGGGSLINGFIESREIIPPWVKRIGFIDSNYGYNSEIGGKMQSWLDSDQHNRLCVFAYNDSIALYQGKPFVSATGGTWFRSKMMIIDLSQEREFMLTTLHEEITEYRTTDNQVLILLKENPTREVFHTEQVELNGIIHSTLFGTKAESVRYEYFGAHCYDKYINIKTPSF